MTDEQLAESKKEFNHMMDLLDEFIVAVYIQNKFRHRDPTGENRERVISKRDALWDYMMELRDQ